MGDCKHKFAEDVSGSDFWLTEWCPDCGAVRTGTAVNGDPDVGRWGEWKAPCMGAGHRALLRELSDVTSPRGSWTLDWQPQRCIYESVGEHLQNSELDSDEFGSEAEVQKAIELNSLIVLQWYQHTPGGFIRFAASDLDTLFECVSKYLEDES